MKILPLAVFLSLAALNSFSQCYEYNTEMQNIESSISSAIKNLKKIEKARTFEEAQDIIDKVTGFADEAVKSGSMAESIASECGCENGITASKNIFSITSDLLNLSGKAVDAGDMETLKAMTKKLLTIAENAKTEASYSTSVCDE